MWEKVKYTTVKHAGIWTLELVSVQAFYLCSEKFNVLFWLFSFPIRLTDFGNFYLKIYLQRILPSEYYRQNFTWRISSKLEASPHQLIIEGIFQLGFFNNILMLTFCDLAKRPVRLYDVLICKIVKEASILCFFWISMKKPTYCQLLT